MPTLGLVRFALWKTHPTFYVAMHVHLNVLGLSFPGRFLAPPAWRGPAPRLRPIEIKALSIEQPGRGLSRIEEALLNPFPPLRKMLRKSRWGGYAVPAVVSWKQSGGLVQIAAG
jgi:hypothetical protein